MLTFKKYHGLGNDFIIIDDPETFDTQSIPSLCDRHFGIGADQLLLARPISGQSAHWQYLIYNQDGSQANHCGNGARCLMHYLGTYQQASKTAPLFLQTATTLISGHYHPTCPTVQWSLDAHQVIPNKTGVFVNIGNPHLIVQPKIWAPDQFEAQAMALQNDTPSGVNVSFIRPIDTHSYQAVVFERGVGRTWACGSAAVAIVLAQARWHQPITIQMPGGPLIVEASQDTYTVRLTGKIKLVFEGRLV